MADVYQWHLSRKLPSKVKL